MLNKRKSRTEIPLVEFGKMYKVLDDGNFYTCPVSKEDIESNSPFASWLKDNYLGAVKQHYAWLTNDRVNDTSFMCGTGDVVILEHVFSEEEERQMLQPFVDAFDDNDLYNHRRFILVRTPVCFGFCDESAEEQMFELLEQNDIW